MNILALTSAYPHPDDNDIVVTPTVKYFCEKWSEAGHRVVVIHNSSSFPVFFYIVPERVREKISSKAGFSFPSFSSKKRLYRKENGVEIFRIPLTKYIPHAKIGEHGIRSHVKKIEEELERIQFVPDIIVSHWVNPQIQIILPLKMKYNAIASLVFHTDCTSKNIQRFDLINKITKLDAVGCRNKTEAVIVKKQLSLQYEPFICYSGIPDVEANKYMDSLKSGNLLRENKREFIYVGRLVKYKNVDVIIRALAIAFPGEQYRLHIVGDGPELENLRGICRDLSSEKNVLFHGKMNRDEVFGLLQKTSCFIMVSDNETFGMVYLEAMIAGCITVASLGGGVDGVIVDGVNGFLSKQKDVESLISKLHFIDNLSKEECSKIRTNAVKTAFEYRDSSVAERYLYDVKNWKQQQ